MNNSSIFDNYLYGTMSPAERMEMEQRLESDAAFAAEFNAHKLLVATLNSLHEKQALKNKLSTIHTTAFGPANTRSIRSGKRSTYPYLKPVALAASVIVIAVLSTIGILSAGGYLVTNNNHSLTELKRKVNLLETSDRLIIDNLAGSTKKRKQFAPANFEGTGFALNNKGYLITSLHMVKGADSIFAENASLERVSARIVYTDNRLDLAILRLDSNNLLKGKDVPFAFRKSNSELGEKIFTLGYPSTDIVYGDGSISSSSGSGDTSMYQISIPVNPGNSGGPLLDEQGFLVGLVRGKNSHAEGTGYAVKALCIYQLLASLEDKALKSELAPGKKNHLKGISRSEQIRRIKPFVFNIKVYKNS